ncbi:MAG: YchJ family protein [Methylococcaceae bacterium]|nr:YchJ family protein [Methylococcaceae bacterium]
MASVNHDMLCPCKSNKTYKACCQPLHDGHLRANSAEQLMCSRYSAFVLKNTDYLIATLHPDKREADDETVLKQTMAQTQWLGLKIIAHHPNGKTASVEFAAFFQGESELEQLHERSHFINENAHWFYVDGEILPAIKLSRNDLCFCGSGKKVKKCHIP